MQKTTYGAAEILRLLNGLLAVITGITAIALTLGIYCGHTGGQMYTVPLVQSRLRLLLIPAGLWLCCSFAALVAAGAPKKAVLAPKPAYSGTPALRRCAWAAAGAAVLWMLVYLCTVGNFESRDLEMTVGKMVLWLSPAAAILLTAAYLLQKQSSPKPADLPARTAAVIRLVLMILAVILLAAGVRNGGMRDVLVKAINICTECIGLG